MIMVTHNLQMTMMGKKYFSIKNIHEQCIMNVHLHFTKFQMMTSISIKYYL